MTATTAVYAPISPPAVSAEDSAAVGQMVIAPVAGSECRLAPVRQHFG